MVDDQLGAAEKQSSASTTVEERLQVLEDERDIRNLIIKYAHLLDAKDHKGYAQLFAVEGRWSGRMGDATGPAAIEAMLVEAFGPTPEDYWNTQNFHLMSNILIEVDGDSAKAESRLVYFARNAEARPAAMLGARYFDELIRENGRWCFSYRRVLGDIPTRAEAPVRTAEEAGYER